ncbi:MAG: SirB2 family protein [Gammaproteobacteria bacterium]|nr:SirB2 family protein [Gammaproteobacteria bacterium]
MSYGWIKVVHMSCAALSFGLFLTRGVWMLRAPQRLRQMWVRVLPHIVDSVLLLSAVVLAVRSRQYPGVDAWLTAKVVALLSYIALGMVAFRFARGRRARATAWVSALLVFGYIVAVARSRNVWPF